MSISKEQLLRKRDALSFAIGNLEKAHQILSDIGYQYLDMDTVVRLEDIMHRTQRLRKRLLRELAYVEDEVVQREVDSYSSKEE
jgi:hypothetical protein